MLDLTIFNRIMGAFMVALDGAFGALQIYSLGLLGTLAFVYYGLHFGSMVTRPSYASEALGDFLWMILKIGAFYWLLFVLYDLMWNRALPTFIQWGAEASGGVFTAAHFREPSMIIEVGFRVAYPVKSFLDRFIGMDLPFYLVDLGMGAVAYWLTILAFGFIALAMMMAMIEFKLAVATGTVLIPWGIVAQTASLGELSLSWLVAGLVRVLMITIIGGIALPLFDALALPLPGVTGDPSVAQTMTLPIAALFFAVLAWVVPNRAAGFAGRGMALALTGEHVMGGSMTAMAGIRASARLAGGAIRGTSRLQHAP
jgi:P-type conjugative transfer protein TrbL